MELVVLLAVTLGVIGLAGRLPDARRVKRDLARGPLEPLGSLADGKTVTVHGRVQLVDAETQLVAALTGRPCVYWLITFDELGIGGDYREIGRADAGCPFLLTAESGIARIVPDKPRVALPGETQIRRALDLDDSARNDALIRLARSVCKRPNYPETSSLRATEYVVTAGMEVTVKGYCTHEPDPTAADDVTGYRAELPTRPVISGSRRARLMIG